MATYTYVECMHVWKSHGLVSFLLLLLLSIPGKSLLSCAPTGCVHIHTVFLFSRKSCFEIHSFSPRLCL